MPRGDGTGPRGTGPMTGRAAGYCAGFDMPGYADPVPGGRMGSGFGRGRGFAGRGRGGGGRGYRHWFYATGQPGWMRFGAYDGAHPSRDPGIEKKALERQAEDLESALEAVRKRLSEMGNEEAAG
jgi:hypothetical protein